MQRSSKLKGARLSTFVELESPSISTRFHDQCSVLTKRRLPSSICAPMPTPDWVHCDFDSVPTGRYVSPNSPMDTDGRRENSGRG